MKAILTSLFVFTLVLWSSNAFAAAYIKFDGISGEVEVANARIPGSSFAATSRGRGIFKEGYAKNGQRSGRMSAGNLTVVMSLDKASPKLLEALSSGMRIPQVTITGYRGGGKSGKYFTHTFVNLQVKGFRRVKKKENNLGEVSFGFEEIKWTMK